MKLEKPEHPKPGDASERRKVRPVICYPVDSLVQPDLASYRAARRDGKNCRRPIVPPREARCFDVPAGCFFRIVSIDGPQVGDLNLWYAGNLRSASSRARRAHFTARIFRPGTGCGRRFPFLRPMATITETLSTGTASTNGADRCMT